MCVIENENLFNSAWRNDRRHINTAQKFRVQNPVNLDALEFMEFLGTFIYPFLFIAKRAIYIHKEVLL